MSRFLYNYEQPATCRSTCIIRNFSRERFGFFVRMGNFWGGGFWIFFLKTLANWRIFPKKDFLTPSLNIPLCRNIQTRRIFSNLSNLRFKLLINSVNFIKIILKISHSILIKITSFSSSTRDAQMRHVYQFSHTYNQ